MGCPERGEKTLGEAAAGKAQRPAGHGPRAGRRGGVLASALTSLPLPARGGASGSSQRASRLSASVRRPSRS